MTRKTSAFKKQTTKIYKYIKIHIFGQDLVDYSYGTNPTRLIQLNTTYQGMAETQIVRTHGCVFILVKVLGTLNTFSRFVFAEGILTM